MKGVEPPAFLLESLVGPAIFHVARTKIEMAGKMSDIKKLLKSSVEKCLDNKLAIPFSAGLDSSVMTWIAKEKSDVMLITVGTKESEDVLLAKKYAKKWKLPIVVDVLGEKDILSLYSKCSHLLKTKDLMQIELAMPVYECARIAKENGMKTMLSGQGAEELFVGYERYYDYLEKGGDLDALIKSEIKNIHARELWRNERMASQFVIEARYPFLEKKLVEAVLSIPISERIEKKGRVKKPLLRAVAKELGLPKEICARRKRAVQYGSGIHKALLKLLKRNKK